MRRSRLRPAAWTLSLALAWPAAAGAGPATYCNPINLDYGYCPIPDFVEQGKHRATADPVIVLFQGDYYLFSTNQKGYWWSDDMSSWNFVPRSFLKPQNHVYDDLCAPAALVLGGSLYLTGSTHSQDFPLWVSTSPRTDTWQEAVSSYPAGAWDPAFFADDDGKVYLYHGSSNLYPIYGVELDHKTLLPVGEQRELIRLQDDVHGWERFGEHNDNTFLRPFIEGSWMTKHGGRYYLQYGTPGTEFSGYGDGVYVSDHPLGPFIYQEHNPFSYKPGGFARGAGHGATFQDKSGHWWHVSTIVIGVKNNFERRIGIWSAGFDRDGTLFCDTAYGDYPHYLPDRKDGRGGLFTGWMLLNYSKPVQVSSTYGGHAANLAVDEDLKTYWSAATGEPGEWLQTDLGAVCDVRAVQIDYADQDAQFMGKQQGTYHQYRLLTSEDGKTWSVMADKSRNLTDVPHDYVELPASAPARFLKLDNVHMPTGRFALSGLRVFGTGRGRAPAAVRHFLALRGDSERRNAWLKWQAGDDAVGYTVRAGAAPDKLYTSITVYGANEYYFTALDKDRPHYFQIEAFNENGIGERSPVVKAP